MNIDNFLKNEKTSKSNILFTVPKKDRRDDMLSIKNNIYEQFILHQCDILYLSASQFGFQYCLICINIYNSKMDAVKILRI